MNHNSFYLDAVRLLFLLVAGGQKPDSISAAGESLLFQGNTRLCAFDFWMRYPDYLADELIELFDKTGDNRLLDIAAQIFIDDEPDLRRIPMIRWRFGAYEKLDDALAILCSREMIRIGGRRTVDRVLETDYLVLPKAIQTCQGIEKQAPVLKWYRERSALVSRIANGRNGNELKQRQYERIEYASTKLGATIPSIADDVRSRLLDRRKPSTTRA